MDDNTRQIIEELRAENRQLRERIEQLENENRRLREQLEQIQKLAMRQAAPFRREERLKIPPEQKKRPGSKPGHCGHFRVVPNHIDQTVEVPLTQCPHCGGQVSDCSRVEQIIEEIEPVRPRVVKIITYRGVCRCCGKDVCSRHPLRTSDATGCAKVRLGPRALALAACLNKVHGLTMRTTCRVIKDLAGLHITAGGLSQALVRVADKVKNSYNTLIQDIRGSPAAFADETSWWVGGPGWWLWAFTTQKATLYRVEICLWIRWIRDAFVCSRLYLRCRCQSISPICKRIIQKTGLGNL